MFIQIIQGKCTKQDDMHRHMDRWRAELAPSAEGWLGGTYGFTDDDMFVGIVRFESEEAARRNSNRAEQTAWWNEAAKLFDGEVTFHDCTDVMMFLEGGSDEAGFVQVIQGRVTDKDRLRTLMDEGAQSLHEFRPDIIGGTIAIEPDGTFTETVAFKSEAEAREGERREPPTEMRRMLDEEMGLMQDVRYLDLHQPWFASRSESPKRAM
ncbi:MAG TPA: hypothetical protein VGJ44_11415 [Kribbellaceae bacterium]